jgi:(p)ppGpp synthase/HD superfamily hydrolase
MLFTPKIRLALKIAATQHQGQFRKDQNTPFIIHPVEVALIVSEISADENTLCAALLHDVLEDTTGYSIENLTSDFGSKTADIVSSLTDTPHPELSWDEKHHLYLEELAKAQDESVLICLADKYSNVSVGPANPDRVWYYKGVIKIAETRQITKDSQLLSDFKKLVFSR